MSWAKKILRVNLTEGSVSEEPLNMEWAAEYIGQPGVVGREDIVANCDYVGPGYGVPTDSMNEAILLLARLEGLLFDPVYSGKALAGMIDLVRTGQFESAETIVFLHTGGSAALFAYLDQLQT